MFSPVDCTFLIDFHVMEWRIRCIALKPQCTFLCLLLCQVFNIAPFSLSVANAFFIRSQMLHLSKQTKQKNIYLLTVLVYLQKKTKRRIHRTHGIAMQARKLSWLFPILAFIKLICFVSFSLFSSFVVVLWFH